MIFDTHCHLGFGETDARRLAERATEAGVSTMLDVGIDLASSLLARDRARALPGVLSSAGLHPNQADQLDDEWPELEQLARSPACTAIGETGLDFHWDRCSERQQVRSFARHLDLAAATGKPVVVHCREAFPRIFGVLAEHPDARGVFHCFSGGVPEARAALDLGFYLSFAGPLTYPRADALRDAAAFAPADRIVVETDAPFLPPEGRRGQKNEPAFIVATVSTVARVREISFDEAAATTAENGRQLFGLPPDA